MWTLALTCVAILAYVYVGYMALVWGIVRLRGPRVVHADARHRPHVTLIISAFNEAPVIGRKIENALALDYPPALFDVVVVSDASDDGTDAIVRAFANPRVTLWCQTAREGKTAGLNAVMPHIASDVVVFSDANAMYDPGAVAALVRNFADPYVGCVVGEARYTTETRSSAGRGENAYWSYEIRLKRLESALGSMVGGDGAIYAIRRSLWTSLPPNAINDFLNPLQIVNAGYRAVYDGDAVCYEEPADDMRREVNRRVRIVSRSWKAIFLVPSVLNPFRTGLFALCLFSHKILRWFSAVWLIGAVVGLAGATIPWMLAHEPAVVTAGLIAALLAFLVTPIRRLLGIGTYFFLVQWASFVGLLKGTFGFTSGVWTPPRHREDIATSRTLALHPLALLPLAIIGAAGLLAAIAASPMAAVGAIFWATIALIAYAYVVYPLLLAILLPMCSSPIQPRRDGPSVALLITANDEASVIEAKLANSLACDYPRERLQIVVASDGSVDATNALVSRYASRGVQLLAFAERRGKMAAMNRAVEEIDADIVVMTDANVMLRPDALTHLVAAFSDPTVGAASADVVLQGARAALDWSEDLYYRYERWLQRAESRMGSMVGVDGGLFAVRRSLYVAPADDTILDDVAIAMEIARLGYRVVMVPEAKAYEDGSISSAQEFGRKARIAAGAVQFLRTEASRVSLERPQLLFTLFSHKIARWLSPVAAVLALLSGVVMAVASPFYLVLMSAFTLLIVIGLLGLSAELRRFPPIGLGYYLCLMQAATLVGLVRGFTGRQRVTWRRFARVA
jgi:cellulose synthase/poly-beta-1,6-N-acetylglucosamine synthase-like glycosyltransferase